MPNRKALYIILIVLFILAGILDGIIYYDQNNKLKVVFFDVGQGDAILIEQGSNQILIDGGPDGKKVMEKLGEYVPFWDREINIVVNSHPQNDHVKGLISVLNRYTVDDVVRSDLTSSSDVYAQFIDVIKTHHVPVRLVSAGEHITVGPTSLSVIWPSESHVLGVTTDANLNDGCVVLWLHYGSFDALFPGDADAHVEPYYVGGPLADGRVEVLKVPHHGSRTGMTQAFVDWLKPAVSIISVGKNSYGHPSKEAIDMLQNIGSKILRTDQKGDIEITSDGKDFGVLTK